MELRRRRGEIWSDGQCQLFCCLQIGNVLYLTVIGEKLVYPNVLNAGGAGGGSCDDYGDDPASISETKRKTGKKGR